MFGKNRRSKLHPEPESIESAEVREGSPEGRDESPTGLNYAGNFEPEDVEHLWEDGAAAERRRDPLRNR